MFLSPDLKIPAKKLGASKFRGQQGDKDEKVKIVKVFIYNKLLNSNISWAAKEKYDKCESREYAREQARKHREVLAQVEAELNLPKSLRRYAMKAQEEE